MMMHTDPTWLLPVLVVLAVIGLMTVIALAVALAATAWSGRLPGKRETAGRRVPVLRVL